MDGRYDHCGIGAGRLLRQRSARRGVARSAGDDTAAECGLLERNADGKVDDHLENSFGRNVGQDLSCAEDLRGDGEDIIDRTIREPVGGWHSGAGARIGPSRPDRRHRPQRAVGARIASRS